MGSTHTFHDLFYHLVFVTKEREPCIRGAAEHRLLEASFKAKANKLGAMLLGFGSWIDHGHLFLRARPVRSLSDLAGQLKGFSARVWNIKLPELKLEWGRGYYAATACPRDHRALLRYIRNQRDYHRRRLLVDWWEAEELLDRARSRSPTPPPRTEALALSEGLPRLGHHGPGL